MKAIFSIRIVSKSGNNECTMRKITDLPFAPFVGMEIEDSVWKKPRPALSVCLSIDEDGQYLYIELGMYEVATDKAFEQLLQAYLLKGWKKSSVNN